MRQITHILVCYWTTDDPKFSMQKIDRIYRRLGYMGTPYHLMVKRDGTLEHGRTGDKAGALDYPHAATSMNVVVVIPPDKKGTGETSKYTPEQRETMAILLRQMRQVHVGAKLEVVAPTRNSNVEWKYGADEDGD